MSQKIYISPHDLSMTTQEVVDGFFKELQDAIVSDIENGIQKERSHLHKRVKDVLELHNNESTSQDDQKILVTQPSYKMVVDNFVKKLGNAIDADIQSRILEERVLLHKKVKRLIEMPEFATASQACLNLNDSASFISITVKSVLRKEEFFTIKGDSKLRKLMMEYCERVSTDFHKTRFLYAGRRITDEMTPDQLEMMDGTQIYASLIR